MNLAMADKILMTLFVEIFDWKIDCWQKNLSFILSKQEVMSSKS